MAELSKASVSCLFGDILPAASLLRQEGQGLRQPTTPQRGHGRDGAKPAERPQKFQKGKGKGAKDKRAREESDHSSQDHPESQLLSMMAQICLRHEDSIQILRLDKAYCLMFKTKGEETILATISDLAKRWEELKEARKTDCAKRIALLKGVLLELQARVCKMVESEDKVRKLIELGWASKQEGRELMWQPLVWSMENQKDIPHPDLGPLPHTQAVRALEVLLEHACSQVVQRFHATRPMAPTYKGEMLEFALEISMKGSKPMQVHDALATLSHSAMWLLIGARMRPELPKRSGLAKKIQHWLANGSLPYRCATQETPAIRMPLSCLGSGL